MKKPSDYLLPFVVIMLFIAFEGKGRCQSASVQNGQAQPLQMPEHPMHAAPHAMGSEQNLLDNSAISYAQGERPMSEFLSEPKPEVPLGDIARYYRDHKYVPKEDDNGK
jgi:hypothetical protein